MVNVCNVLTGILVVFLFVFGVPLVDRRSSLLFSQQSQPPQGQPIYPVNARNIRFAGQFATGSSTGGIQEAINDITGNGEVWVIANVTATAAIHMKASVNVRGIGDNISVTFTGATDGFVWPGRTSGSLANYARLYSLAVVAGNPSSGKAIDIEDPSSAAGGVVVEDVRITSSKAPANVWAYGIFLSNALLERFSRMRLQSATVHIHADGFSNSDDFENVDLTSNIASATYVDIQGGYLTFIGGEIEGNATGELVRITQPGAAGAKAKFLGTNFENANRSGIGIHANVGNFECENCSFSTSARLGVVIGDVSSTKGCKILGGSGASWVLGPHAIRNTIVGFTYSGTPPLDSSPAGSNTLFDNFSASDNSYAASSWGEVPNFPNGISVPYGVTPTTYDAGGKKQKNTHIVEDSCTLGRNCSITFSGSAAFTDATTYHCAATDAVAAHAVRVNQTSGSAAAFTGTGGDDISFICVGY